ncbi:DUF3055 domain-containing protein [Exiguobacterium oxidotolerans]|uniref:DUF3055 domain-containing protein n=1 Tax=Exiguobacterium oxidotolerans TaxID=223958 RepID=UPI000551EEDE|nr:DUF3055 domain-containing protein [Exiguobacterium oxidotolerans]
MMEELDFLYDDVEQTKTRFICWIGETSRFDLAITHSEHFFGKILVLNLLSNRFAIIGADDFDEPGYIAHAFDLEKDAADELERYLSEYIGLT